MSKGKTLIGLAVMVGLFIMAATPAGAFFRSNSSATTGSGSAGETTFGDEGASVTCASATGEWQIRSTGKVAEETKGPGQHLTKEGPHMDLVVKAWNKCTAFGFVGAEVKPCTLQLEQTAKGSLVATGTVVTECIVTAKGNCELKVAPGPANEHLKTITLANVEGGTEDTANVNVSGVLSTATSLGGLGCVGVKSGKNANGTEKGIVTGIGQQVV